MGGVVEYMCAWASALFFHFKTALFDSQSFEAVWLRMPIELQFVIQVAFKIFLHFMFNTTTEQPVINTSIGIFFYYCSTSWEFPEIVSGKYHMIGDADGKQYPWYGSRLELSTVQGPSSTQAVTIHMNDNFFPQV